MSSRKPIGVAVIGYGYWSPKLIRNVINNPHCKLIAVCEKDIKRHALIRSEVPNIVIEDDYRTVFARSDVDAVIIATIPSSHFRIAKIALESDKHVLVEKPMTLSIEEGEMLVKQAQERKRTLMVDHTYLYNPGIQALRDIIQRGELGKIYSIESTRVNLGLFQRDTNVVWDLAPHDFSILRSLVPERPTHVAAIGSKTVVHPKQERAQESIAHLMIYYPGFIAHIHVSWVSAVKVRQFTVVGSERMAMYDQLAADPLKIFDKGVYPTQDSGESGPLFEYKTGEERAVELPVGNEDLSAMIQDFVDSISNGKNPISNAELGLDVVRMLCAADRSLARGGTKTAVEYTGYTSWYLSLRERIMRIRHGY